MYRRKNVIIIIMCIAVLLMSVGYALISTRITINGTTSVTSTWNVIFSDIRTIEQKGGATNKVAPSVNNTTATFEVDLVEPGDEITYEIDITNYGDIKAEIQSATYEISGSEAIYVELTGIRKGTVIDHCEGLTVCPKVTAIVKVGYDPATVKDPNQKRKEISITLNIGQYVASNPTKDGVLIEEIDEDKTLVQRILKDNTLQPDVNINFGAISSDTNGKGLYYTSTATEDNKGTYYFRGAVDNNYVYFGGFYWRIVRINEDGSIRLIYQGKTANASGSAATIGSSVFHELFDDNAYVGYMFGARRSSTYAATHTNTNESTIKQYIDDWYEANLKEKYSSYLADAGFCNDRSKEDKAGVWDSKDTAEGYSALRTFYGPYNREKYKKVPILSCPNSDRDLFTTKTSTKGNKALDYPIGMLTSDELLYAGTSYGYNNTNFYLYVATDVWTMSPGYYAGGAAPIASTITGNITASKYGNESIGVRPVINLKSNVEITKGTGKSTDPYIIRTN